MGGFRFEATNICANSINGDYLLPCAKFFEPSLALSAFSPLYSVSFHSGGEILKYLSLFASKVLVFSCLCSLLLGVLPRCSHLKMVN